MENLILGAFEDVPEDEYLALSQSQHLSSSISDYDPNMDSYQTSSQDTDSKVRTIQLDYFATGYF